MRKRAFQLRSVIEDGLGAQVVLTYNLQEIQPWKQSTPRYQTAVYAADAGGLAVGKLLHGPIDHLSEDLARRGHAAIVAERRRGGADVASAHIGASVTAAPAPPAREMRIEPAPSPASTSLRTPRRRDSEVGNGAGARKAARPREAPAARALAATG